MCVDTASQGTAFTHSLWDWHPWVGAVATWGGFVDALPMKIKMKETCLLYTSDAADEERLV